MNSYFHVQKSPLCLLIYLMTAVAWAIAIMLRDSSACLAPLIGGAFGLVVAMSFHHLRVADAGEILRINFGPIPLFQRQVRFELIRSAEPGRTLLLDGWGIHMSVRGGWVWNIWGRDCVVVHLERGTLRIGTDDAENLAAFLNSKIIQPGR